MEALSTVLFPLSRVLFPLSRVFFPDSHVKPQSMATQDRDSAAEKPNPTQMNVSTLGCLGTVFVVDMVMVSSRIGLG